MVTHFRIRLYILAVLVMAGFTALIFRLYEVQVTESDYYTKRVPVKKEVSVRIPGTRGEIKDRNGITLVDSTPNYELRFDLREIVAAWSKKHPGLKRPAHKWERFDRRGLREIKTETDIVAIVEEMVWPGLTKLGLLADYSAGAMRVQYRSSNGLVPFTFRRDLSFKEFARFAENNLGIPGVTITRTGRRRYLYDSLGVHFLGYLNLADNDHVPTEKKKEYNYYVGDDYGVMGVEKTMDSFLQGRAGKLIIQKDEKGKFVREISRTEAKPGPNVLLTIDAKLQLVAEQSLRKIGRGAAVAIDPRNGDILAMASVPSYNPNVFIPEVNLNDWNRITKDTTNPLINRAINAYCPGSTGKIPVALAGCLSDSWKYRFPCGGGKQYGKKFMKCWHSNHGSVDVSTAIKKSCNGFFYRYANHTGIRNIQTVTGLLGLGRVTGARITGEKSGTIPNPEWLRAQGLVWSDAFTALTAIGQGATECTPLQMASVTATVANGGKVYQPRIIKKVAEKNGDIVWEEPPKLRHELTKEGITAEQIELIKRGMWRVVNEGGGTAGRARSKLTVLSGKTGTAQTSVPNVSNAWFISFAPYDKPEIAVCVFVENGRSGGGAASPIAKNIIENHFVMKEGKETKLVALPSAIGNTQQVTGVSFDGASQELLAFVEQQAASEESAVDVNAFLPQSMKKKRAFTPLDRNFIIPTIKDRVDSRGRVGALNTRSKPKFQPFKNLFRRKKKR